EHPHSAGLHVRKSISNQAIDIPVNFLVKRSVVVGLEVVEVGSDPIGRLLAQQKQRLLELNWLERLAAACSQDQEVPIDSAHFEHASPVLHSPHRASSRTTGHTNHERENPQFQVLGFPLFQIKALAVRAPSDRRCTGEPGAPLADDSLATANL